MIKSITTSVRLTTDINAQLNQAALILHRGKNWIITHAIERYLSEMKPLTLTEEAKRQSILASQSMNTEDDIWEDNVDIENWK